MIREVLGWRAATLHVMGARDYFFDTRFKSWLFSTTFNTLPFERKDHEGLALHLLKGLALCRQVLDRGRSLLIYPEATRSRTGELQAFKPGVGILVLELDYPVIPLHVSGTYESMPSGSAIPKPSLIRVRFGRAVDMAELRAKSLGPRKPYREAAQEIREAVAKLSSAP